MGTPVFPVPFVFLVILITLYSSRQALTLWLMTLFLHRLSALLFYLLGASFFAAYLLMRNEIAADVLSWWMQVADLPLALAAVLYGGTSLYLSVTPSGESSRATGIAIGLPLTLLFVGLVVLNFWELIT